MLQVWRARCKQSGEIVAIKVMDLENVNCSLVRCSAKDSVRQLLRWRHVVDARILLSHAGGDREGGADDAAAAPP